MSQFQFVWVFEAIIKILILLSISSSSCVYAIDHYVGGQKGWDLTSDLPNWSSSTTFTQGDNLVFVYGTGHNVLEVDNTAFATCNTTSPIKTNNGGQTRVDLDTVGTRYFICGTPGHCEAGLKVQVNVQAARNSSAGSDGRLPKFPPPTPKSPPPRIIPPPPATKSPPPPNPNRRPPPPPEDDETPDTPDILSAPGPNSHKGSATKVHIHGLVITSLMSSVVIFMISI